MLQQKPRLDTTRNSSIYGDDVSPPDSPRTQDGRRMSSSPNISPITDAGSGHRFPSARTSNIPLPRQASNGGTSNFISGWREKIAAAQAAGGDGKVKWDAYSGDPTGAPTGKDSTARPGATTFENNLGTSSYISAVPQPKGSLFGVNLKKTRKDVPAPARGPKEEWKGASGRSPILPQVEQKANPTKFFPSPMQRRQKGGFRQAMGFKSTVERTASPVAQGALNPAIRVNTQNYDDLPNDSDLETPTADTPLEDRVIPPRGISMGQDSTPQRRATEDDTDQRPPPPAVPSKSATVPIPQPITRKPITPRAHTPEPDANPEPLPQQQDYNPGHVAEAFAALGLENNPGSRFSATTFNTTIPEADEEPDLPYSEPELPDLPMPRESVLNRKRPVQTAGYLPPRMQNPSRKPTPSQRDLVALPPPPAEEAIVDRVSLLEAKLSSLNKRKSNISTVIHELTNVVQPSSIAYDNASRQEIKKTVESLQVESAAVAKEIHETGLKLHRAMKKRDEDGAFEPTGLWVRRVTE